MLTFNTLFLEFSLFDAGHVVGPVDNSELNEISGMVFSRRHDNVIYVHNDSGGYARWVSENKVGVMSAIISDLGETKGLH